MQKFSWSLERILVIGCVGILLVLIPVVSLISHRTKPQGDSQASGSSGIVPEDDDIAQILQPGTPAPIFDSTILGGKPFSSRHLAGRVAVIDFWATWCGPCQMAIPGVEDLHTRYAARGVQVVGVSMDTDTAASVKPYVAHMKMTYTVLVDPNQNIIAGNLYEAAGLPSIYVIDKHQRIRWSASGYYPGEEDTLTHVVDRLLSEK